MTPVKRAVKAEPCDLHRVSRPPQRGLVGEERGDRRIEANVLTHG